MRNINTILKNRNGKLILILPAFSFLYSNWDKSVGHFRRYDYGEIKHKLKATGFLVENYFYINIVGFFGWFINGKILRNTPAKSRSIEWQAVFFDKYIVNVLRRLEKMFRPPFGQSLIMVVRPI